MIETILNDSYHDTTEMTPHEALYGEKPRRNEYHKWNVIENGKIKES